MTVNHEGSLGQQVGSVTVIELRPDITTERSDITSINHCPLTWCQLFFSQRHWLPVDPLL